MSDILLTADQPKLAFEGCKFDMVPEHWCANCVPEGECSPVQTLRFGMHDTVGIERQNRVRVRRLHDFKKFAGLR